MEIKESFENLIMHIVVEEDETEKLQDLPLNIKLISKTPISINNENFNEYTIFYNDEMMDQIIFRFCEIYSHLIENKNTNFEGINKFLLNLEVSNLQDYNVKEQINELYYQITHELIRSFELLYKGK